MSSYGRFATGIQLLGSGTGIPRGETLAPEAQPLPSLVVVPRRPGPLIVPPAGGASARDEVDEGLDELFGPPVQQKPGALDAVLVVGGIATIVFAEVVYDGGGLAALGALGVALGLALPVRSLWRGAQRRRSSQRFAATLKLGDPLNLNDRTTRRLAESYTRIEQLVLGSGGDDPTAAEALEASLEALREVAALLRGRSPHGAAETEYVARRTAAVEGLARSLVPAGLTARDAAVEALSEFEERTGVSSLDRIAGIRAASGRGGPR